MGFMDNFTSDSPVTVKQPDYYEMVKEAAKAELITNAVNAEVPGYYIQAMITGKKPDFLNTLDAEEEKTGFRTEYEQITGAAVSIFETMTKERSIEAATIGLHKLINAISQSHIEEIKAIEENQKEREKQKAREHNMMQTAAVQKISEQNSPYKAMLDRAYMIGYTDAMNQERSRRRAARERRERKKYFAMQKLNGVALLIFTAVAIKILEGDATIAFITVPLGLSMLLSKEMLIINKYYWKCEEKAERGVQ